MEKIGSERTKRKSLVLLILTLTLLGLSFYSFFGAYQLWKEYQNAIEWFSIPRPAPSHDFYNNYVLPRIETYTRYFPLYLFCGLVALEGAIIVFIFQTKLIYLDLSKPFVSFQPLPLKVGTKKLTFTLGIVVSGLLIISGFLLYGAYDLWSRYQSSQEEWYIVPQVDYHRIVDAQIETYEKLFLPYLLGGLGTISLASKIILALSQRRKNP